MGMLNEKDPLDDLFVCSSCGASIAKDMPSLNEYKRRLRAAQGALEEALQYIEKFKKK